MSGCGRMEKTILREELLRVLKESQKARKLGEELLKIMEKIRREKRLKSAEFLKIQEIIWKEGPKIKYQCPDEWNIALKLRKREKRKILIV
jgi:hypothetical protein